MFRQRDTSGINLPLLLKVNEAASQVGIGRTKIYELIDAGELQLVHIGRSARVPQASVDRYVARLCGSDELVSP